MLLGDDGTLYDEDEMSRDEIFNDLEIFGNGAGLGDPFGDAFDEDLGELDEEVVVDEAPPESPPAAGCGVVGGCRGLDVLGAGRGTVKQVKTTGAASHAAPAGAPKGGLRNVKNMKMAGGIAGKILKGGIPVRKPPIAALKHQAKHVVKQQHAKVAAAGAQKVGAAVTAKAKKTVNAKVTHVLGLATSIGAAVAPTKKPLSAKARAAQAKYARSLARLHAAAQFAAGKGAAATAAGKQLASVINKTAGAIAKLRGSGKTTMRGFVEDGDGCSWNDVCDAADEAGISPIAVADAIGWFDICGSVPTPDGGTELQPGDQGYVPVDPNNPPDPNNPGALADGTADPNYQPPPGAAGATGDQGTGTTGDSALAQYYPQTTPDGATVNADGSVDLPDGSHVDAQGQVTRDYQPLPAQQYGTETWDNAPDDGVVYDGSKGWGEGVLVSASLLFGGASPAATVKAAATGDVTQSALPDGFYYSSRDGGWHLRFTATTNEPLPAVPVQWHSGIGADYTMSGTPVTLSDAKYGDRPGYYIVDTDGRALIIWGGQGGNTNTLAYVDRGSGPWQISNALFQGTAAIKTTPVTAQHDIHVSDLGQADSSLPAWALAAKKAFPGLSNDSGSVAQASAIGGYGPLVSIAQAGGVTGSSDLALLEFALHDAKGGKWVWFWQAANAPSWATYAADHAADLLSVATAETDRKTAAAQAASQYQTDAQVQAAKDAQDAAEALRESAATSAQTAADEAKQLAETTTATQATTFDEQQREAQAQIDIQRQQLDLQQAPQAEAPGYPADYYPTDQEVVDQGDQGFADSMASEDQGIDEGAGQGGADGSPFADDSAFVDDGSGAGYVDAGDGGDTADGWDESMQFYDESTSAIADALDQSPTIDDEATQEIEADQ